MKSALFAASLFGLFLGADGSARASCALAKNAAAILYATDREPVGGQQLFSGERGIANDRKPIVSYGVLSKPVSSKTQQRCSSSAEFIRAVGTGLAAKGPKRILIYVHGYYTTFQTAAQNAIAIERELKFPGPVILYSWPSKVTSLLAYLTDETNASWSTIHYRTMIASLRRAYPRASIAFASHSLGSRFAAAGIGQLREGGCTKCLGRSLFFAPDIDSSTLHAELSEAQTCNGRPHAKPAQSALVTLYVSNKDVALRQSQRVHGHQRAGQAGSELILCNGVDTIDVSRFKSSDKAGHGYFLDRRIGDDYRAAFAGFPPGSAQRKLREVRRPGGVYYELNR